MPWKIAGYDPMYLGPIKLVKHHCLICQD